jgi:hypothetical protein
VSADLPIAVKNAVGESMMPVSKCSSVSKQGSLGDDVPKPSLPLGAGGGLIAALFTKLRVREGARVGLTLRLRSESEQDMFPTSEIDRVAQRSPAV